MLRRWSLKRADARDVVRLLDAAVTIVVLTVTAGIWFARLVRKWRQNRLSKYTAL